MDSFGIQAAFGTWYGATVMSILLVMSVYLLSLIIVRYNFFRKMQVDAEPLMRRAQEAFVKDNEKSLAELKGQFPSDPPLRILVAYGLANTHLGVAEMAELFSVV